MSSLDLSSFITLIPLLIGLWIAVSVPVYVSAKLVTNGRAKFIQAMGATVLGPFVYVLVLLATSFALGFTGVVATLPAVLLALLAWLGVYKSSFKTSWLAALGIAALALTIFIVASSIIGVATVTFLPNLPVQPLPTPLQPA